MPEELVSDVFDLTLRETGDGKRYRAYLIEDDVPTLFDVGLPDTADALFEELAAVGREPERVVITHGDGDHVGGLDAVVDRYAPEVYVPAETDLAAGTEPDERFGDGDAVGGFTAVHVPGHGPDTYAFVDEDRSLAVLGDAVSGADQRGLPAGYFHLPPAVYSDDLNRAEGSLERLLAYEFDAGLVYHGAPVLEDASRKLDAYVNFPGKPQ